MANKRVGVYGEHNDPVVQAVMTGLAKFNLQPVLRRAKHFDARQLEPFDIVVVRSSLKKIKDEMIRAYECPVFVIEDEDQDVYKIESIPFSSDLANMATGNSLIMPLKQCGVI